MQVVVLITAPWPVDYSLNNGLSRMQYQPGELYAVPEFAARGMWARGWARVVDKEELDSILKERAQPQELPAFIEPKGPADGTTSDLA